MPRMKKKEMNEAERKYRLAQNYRHFAWRIMVYLKAHPDVLNTNNNQEVYDAVKEIQIQHRLRATPKYTREDAAYHDYYSDVEISYTASKAHPKAAIQIRNREMVDRADLILCCIEREKGGAWQTVKYAMSQNKKIINLAMELD